MSDLSPLILTLQIDEQTFTYFNDLRKKHFPPQINYLDAHVTLFHHLPNNSLVPQLLETVSVNRPIIPLEISQVMKLGRGVAYKLQSPDLIKLQQHLKEQWQEWLTPQDSQRFNPHITVQNKVEVEKANALYIELASCFQPFKAEGIGLSLWEYRGGPWHKIKDFSFQASAGG